MTPPSKETPPSDPFRLDGKIAIVTGASSGLGRRFAQVLHEAGATVIATARRSDRLEELAVETGVHLHSADVTDALQRTRLVNTVAEQFGGVDILVNNAGASKAVPAEQDQTDNARALLELNLLAPYELARITAPIMRSRGGGSIINIASIWGLVGIGVIPDAAYAASKGGLINLTRELAAQWARDSIRVNAIAPGWFRSEMTEDSMFNNERSQSWIARHTPMGRAGEAHELDGALLFLASNASTYVTGTTLPVDGGWTAV